MVQITFPSFYYLLITNALQCLEIENSFIFSFIVCDSKMSQNIVLEGSREWRMLHNVGRHNLYNILSIMFLKHTKARHTPYT